MENIDYSAHSKKMLETLIPKNIPMGIVLIQDFKIRYINDWADTFTGLSSDEMIGRSFFEFVHPDDHNRLVLRHEYSISGKALPEYNRYRIIHKNGDIFWIRFRSKVVEYNGSDALLSFLIDETQVTIIEKRYKTFFNTNPVGTYIASPKGGLIDCNYAFVEIFGFKNKAEALSEPITDLYENPTERSKYLDLLLKKKQIKGFKTNYKNKNGGKIQAIENASASFDEKGNISLIYGFIIDVTNEKQLELQLRQSQKMEAIGTLAGGIAHDFNNILSSIFGYAQLASLHLDEKKKAKFDINKILESAERASKLIQQILTFSRQTEYKKKNLQIKYLVKEVLLFIRSVLPANIKIKENISSDASIFADPTKIHQLIMNLCTNAYQAMNERGGILSIKLEDIEFSEPKTYSNQKIPKGLYARLRVKDTGYGITDEHLKKIFDPYFTTKPQDKGTGIGLSMAHAIVKEHKGFINVESIVGEGTHFDIYLPINDKPEVQESDKKNKFKFAYGKGRILLVDDEEQIRHSMQELLEKCGYKIATYSNGIEAFEAFSSSPQAFDLIITDMTMPKLAGDELAKQIRSIRNNIPIILCSGFNEKCTDDYLEEIGINRFIRKPVLTQDILLIINELLEIH